MKNNLIYKKQYAVLALFASVTLKVLMLPSFMMADCGRQAWFAMLLMMTLEILMFWVVYVVISKQSLLDIEMHKTLKYIIVSFVFFVSVIKGIVVLNETMDYINRSLFEGGLWQYKLIALMGVVFFITYKGPNVIVRCMQVALWLFVISMVMVLVTFEANMQVDNILPFLPNGIGGVLYACDKHYLWFGDFIPLLFFCMTPKHRDKEKISIPMAFCGMMVFIVGFYILFIALYGEAGVLVDHAFSKLMGFTMAEGLEGILFPVVCIWILIAILRTCLTFYALTEAGTFLFKKRLPVMIVLFLGFTIFAYINGGIETAYDIGTSWIRYIVMAVQYSVPILLLVLTRMHAKKEPKPKAIKKTEQKVKYAEDIQK